jgi:hypothetical protein
MDELSDEYICLDVGYMASEGQQQITALLVQNAVKYLNINQYFI